MARCRYGREIGIAERQPVDLLRLVDDPAPDLIVFRNGHDFGWKIAILLNESGQFVVNDMVLHISFNSSRLRL